MEDQKTNTRLFRYLREDEIEVREGSFVGKDKDRTDILLYKTARTDYALLDETFGPFNWDIQYATVNGATYCGIGIKDPVTFKFVYKWNAGHVAEDTVDYAKALASDACKRAGFAWGLGVELYTAPRIVLQRTVGASYHVQEIKYAEGRIVTLVIADQNGSIVYKMENGQIFKIEPVTVDRSKPWKEQLVEYCKQMAEQTDDPVMLRAFYTYYKDKDQKGMKHGPARCWGFFQTDVKEGTIEVDATDPQHPKVTYVGRK